MLSNKHISKITIILTLAVLVLCILSMSFSDKLFPLTGSIGYGMEYQSELFDTELIDVDIIISEDDWSEMLANAIQEEYYECDVAINGTVFYNVGIRTKGNTSLSSIVNDPDNDRYSFKLEFDRFVDGQTCFGLDKLVLNNNFADTTNMKEAVVYDMFRYLDADAPLCNYAKISVNNEYWGVYLALEAVEDSFMLRNYGAEKGFLYKPEGMNHGAGNSGNGADLNYSDDNLDSYSAIWDGQVNDSSDADRKRVVEALKNIHNRTDIEKYIDVEQVLKYMAVHNFAVNEDSLSGNMAHNYYLYEANGQISILPWDYNLSFGGMNGGSGSDVVNDPIDDSWSSTRLFDFVLESEEYKARYHEYYNRLVNEYLYGGKFEETYNRIRTQIDALVKTDPNAMYSYEEYTKGAETLYETIMLRAESVKGQLDGTIPSTADSQRKASASLTDASHISISDMGQFMGGGNAPGGNRGGEAPPGNSPPKEPTGSEAQAGDFGNPAEIGTPPQNSGDSGNNAEKPDFNAPSAESDNSNSANRRERPSSKNRPDANSQMPDRQQRTSSQAPPQQGEPNGDFEQSSPENAQMPDFPPQNNSQDQPEGRKGRNGQGFEPGQQDTQKSLSEHIKEYSTAYISLLLLAAAFVFIKLYKRKKY